MPEPIYICGATATGKSSKAMEVASKIDGEIVNADAFQLYRGLEIITAAPTAADQEALPHHLYGVFEPTERVDAGRYREMAIPIIEEIQARGKTPVITGGSGLYLKFLTHGPAPLPKGNDALRLKMDNRTLEELVGQLKKIDPVEAERTDLQNRRFVTRALEICLLTGDQASSLRDQWESRTAEISNKLNGIWIQRSRDELHDRISQRTSWMLENGAIEEVECAGELSSTCEKAIGVGEIRRYLAGEIDISTCAEQIRAATRQYAKRQETWFRREKWLDVVHA